MALRSNHGVNDLVLLEDISNEAIYSTIESHFRGDEIYIYIGHLVLSTNPFKEIPGLYSSGTLRKYRNKKEYQNPPHVYAVAERAYRSLCQDLSSECVIITGESGAGKTEASKKVMEYIAEVSNRAGDVGNIKEKILESNPLLEAFGNAKTLRNNNSSRFGKYAEIQFRYGAPVGGRISTYLLEKSRVINRQNQERSFHVFYQLLGGASSHERQDWKLALPDDYSYLRISGCHNVPGINDVRDFHETRKAMEVCGMDATLQQDIFRLLSGILILGNVDFAPASANGNATGKSSGTSGLSIKNREVLNSIADLFRVSAQQLESALTFRTVAARGDKVLTPLDKDAAIFARDSLAKSMYARIFDWIVASINRTMDPGQGQSSLIGILDIYGFEIFEINSFEQLCINFTNERLHQLWVELTLRLEQQEYGKEGITWERIDYLDNLPVCELIEKRGGIFSLLDEECIFPQGTDSSFQAKLVRQLGSSKEFFSNARQATHFGVKHYAGEVTYAVDGFLEKNRDTLFPDLVQLASSSSSRVLKEAFAADAERIKDDLKRPITSCVQFRDSVAKLMNSLKACNQHYIRCIKPNNEKRSGLFERNMVLNQIKYLGLLENVRVRRAGYAFRMKYDSFVAKYKSMASRMPDLNLPAKQNTENLLKEFGLSDYQLGQTKVFIKSPKTVFTLEDLRKRFLEQSASLLPSGEELVFADKVLSYDKSGDKVEFLFLWSSHHVYLYRNGKMKYSYPTIGLHAITVGHTRDGFAIFQVQEMTYGNKNHPPQPTGVTHEILLEGVAKLEIRNVVDVLTCSDTALHVSISESDTIPDSVNPKHAGGGGAGGRNKNKKCIVM